MAGEALTSYRGWLTKRGFPVRRISLSLTKKLNASMLSQVLILLFASNKLCNAGNTGVLSRPALICKQVMVFKPRKEEI